MGNNRKLFCQVLLLSLAKIQWASGNLVYSCPSAYTVDSSKVLVKQTVACSLAAVLSRAEQRPLAGGRLESVGTLYSALLG